MRRGRTHWWSVRHLGESLPVLVAILAAIFPLAWTVRVALRPYSAYLANASGLGGGITVANFTSALNYGLAGGFENSALIVPASSVAATLLATLGGFALCKLPFVGRRLATAVIVGSIAIPVPAIVIPLFDEGLRLGFTDTRWGLGLCYTALFACWGTIFMRSYYLGLPDALLESARIDGANIWQQFRRIALPIAAPAVVTVLVLNFFLQWSELTLGLILMPNSAKQTLTVRIAEFNGQYRTGGPLIAAAAVLASLPIVAIFLSCQRFLRATAFSGAVKG